jgi:hypothetical protein
MKMRKLIAHLVTGYVGSDARVAVTFDDDTPESVISDELYDMAVQHAESYGIYPYPVEELDEEDEDDYTDSIEAYYEEYDPEKHDCLRAGGGSFESDF